MLQLCCQLSRHTQGRVLSYTAMSGQLTTECSHSQQYLHIRLLTILWNLLTVQLERTPRTSSPTGIVAKWSSKGWRAAISKCYHHIWTNSCGGKGMAGQQALNSIIRDIADQYLVWLSQCTPEQPSFLICYQNTPHMRLQEGSSMEA